MTAPAPHLCERGPRCLAAIREHDQLVPAPSDRPLCDVCERAVARALEEAPETYVRLRIATRSKTVAAPSEQVTLSKGSPMPLNGRALDLGEQLWWLLTTWEDEVRLIAGLTEVQRAGRLEGPQVGNAATFLSAHISAWLSAPTTAFSVARWVDGIEQSGPEAASALLDWQRSARVELEGPGPRPAAHCWIEHNGTICDGPIWVAETSGYCGRCGSRWDGADFLRLAALVHDEAHAA